MRLYFSGICFSPSETNKPLTYVADSLILASVGHETPASPFVFRFCLGEFSFVYRLDPCKNQFGPGREGLGRGQAWDLLVRTQYRQGRPSCWPTGLLSGWAPSLLTLGSAAVVALGSWHQSEVSRWFLWGGVSGDQFFGLQAAFPSCCVVKRTHQAVSLTAADGRRRKKIFFRGRPSEPGWVFCLR